MTTEWAQLRQIMYQPTACWLSTEYSGDRWLTDQYVLFNVTDIESFEGLADGAYKLTVSEGPKAREGVPEPDIEAWFARVAEGPIWRPAKPGEWSVAEHPGKAMLWACGVRPCLLGESTWTALKRHHPDALVEYKSDLNMFRFSEVAHGDPTEACEAGTCACPILPFCYAAGIQIPDGQEEAAWALAALLDTTSNQGVGCLS